VTVESADVATVLREDPLTATLIDDIGGWLTAAMDRFDAWTGGAIEPCMAELIDAVGEFRGPLVLVSPKSG
jgi:adenosylcobinamide kinase/adenosylcobinamide-phosphate guanylyltransferase